MTCKILITGASAGFGKLTVHTLLKKGHTVVGSMRGVNGKNRAVTEELKSAGAHVVEIDVTSDDSVEHGVADAMDKAGGLDVVDKMGMGDHIVGYNDQLEQITAGIYGAFGMDGMLKLKA